jgi:BolA protein
VSRKQSIEQKLTQALAPTHLEVNDESHQHSVPAGSESHFNLVVVTEAFSGEARVQRHRRVHELLSEELAAGLHALTLTLLTPDEFAARGGGIASPACMGGSKTG